MYRNGCAGMPISVRVGTAKSFFGPMMDLYWSSLPAVRCTALKSGSGAGISWSMEDKSTSPGSGSDFGAGRGLVGSLSVLAAFCTCDMLIVGLLPFFLTSSWVVECLSHTDYDFNACFFCELCDFCIAIAGICVCVFLENKVCDLPWLEELGQDGLGCFADKTQFLLGIELRKGC